MWRSIHSQPWPCPLRRGVVAQRHDGKGNPLAYLLSKVCKNVEVFDLRSTVISSEARFNIKDGSGSGHAKLQHFLIGVLLLNVSLKQIYMIDLRGA